MLVETERDIEALRLLTPQMSGDPMGQERIQKLHRIVVNEFECVLDTLEQVPKKDAAVVALRDAVKRYGAGEEPGPLNTTEWDIILAAVKAAGRSAITGIGIVNHWLQREWYREIIKGVDAVIDDCKEIAVIPSMHPDDDNLRRNSWRRWGALAKTWQERAQDHGRKQLHEPYALCKSYL